MQDLSDADLRCLNPPALEHSGALFLTFSGFYCIVSPFGLRNVADSRRFTPIPTVLNHYIKIERTNF